MKVIRTTAIAIAAVSALTLTGAAVAHGSKQERCAEHQASAQGEKHQHGKAEGGKHQRQGMGSGHGRMGGMSGNHERMAAMHARMGEMHGGAAAGKTEEHKH